MKRVLALCAATVAIPLATAGAADALIRAGTFRGTTTVGDPVGFKVDSLGRVYSYYYDGVRLRCTDGDQFNTPAGSNRIQTPFRTRFPVRRFNRWSIRSRTAATGVGWDVAAQFLSQGSRAAGTLKVFARFNERNDPDPQGSIRCESGTLRWSAPRLVPTRRR